MHRQRLVERTIKRSCLERGSGYEAIENRRTEGRSARWPSPSFRLWHNPASSTSLACRQAGRLGRQGVGRSLACSDARCALEQSWSLAPLDRPIVLCKYPFSFKRRCALHRAPRGHLGRRAAIFRPFPLLPDLRSSLPHSEFGFHSGLLPGAATLAAALTNFLTYRSSQTGERYPWFWGFK